MNNPRTAFVFSGLGSQYFQMGAEMFALCPQFRAWMRRMNSVVGELTGRSVIDELYLGERRKSEALDDMLLSCTGLFMVEFALAQTLIDSGVRPDVTVGYSLGSYAAATVSGCIDYHTALQMLCEWTEAIVKCAEPGSMLAIMDTDRARVLDLLGGNVELASNNFPGHFVLALPRHALAAAEGALRSACVTFQRLPVSYAFHSRWIDGARSAFLSASDEAVARVATIPMVCCARSQMLSVLPKGFFWSVARGPVQFQKTIEWLHSRAVYRYIDIGPSGTIAAFLKNLLPSQARPSIDDILTPFGRDIEKLERLVKSVRASEHRCGA